MPSDQLTQLSAHELSALICSRKVSPVEAVKACLEQIKAKDGSINAFDQVFEAEALAEAQKAEAEISAGRWIGPMHGVPVAVKDLYATKGAVNKASSRVLDGPAAEEDAFVVQGLKSAGAILLGRLNMHELAFGITSRNPHFGNTLNPWDTTRGCGGSSSGSGAALAAHMTPLALGSDTGGSIRIPSSLCGVAGIKPTYGLLSKAGVASLAWSLDTVGPMARSVQDLGMALDAMRGFDPNDATMCARENPGGYGQAAQEAGGLAGLKVAVPKNYFFELLHPEVEQKVRSAISLMAQADAQTLDADAPMVLEADRAALTILFSEAGACLEYYARNTPEKLGIEVLHNVQLGLTIPASRYIQAQRVRTALAKELNAFFERYDILAVPGTTVTAPPIEATEVELGGRGRLNIRLAMTRFTRYFNIAGIPVLSLPYGFDSQGLPVGIQLAAGYYQEHKLLRAGLALQQMLKA